MTDTENNANDKNMMVALPCEPNQFSNFISGLLGKPQTISNIYHGSFEVDHKEIENVFHLVNQRVLQQNEANLIQFTVKVIYNDNSSVLLNSIEDFKAYSEVRPLVSTQVHLTWSFLVKFQDRNYPEKQEIDLSFVTQSFQSISVFDSEISPSIPLTKLFGTGYAAFRIKHTARTWGADIESLLSGHIQHIILPQPKIRGFVQEHSGKLAFIVGVLFFIGSIAACFISANEISAQQLEIVNTLSENGADLDTKINTLLQTSASGFWGKYFFSLFVFTIFSLFLSILFAIWVETTADTKRPSYILLTKKSKQNKELKEARYSSKWRSFMFSIATSIVTGVVANILFNKYWL